jgi:hypothetical protein
VKTLVLKAFDRLGYVIVAKDDYGYTSDFSPDLTAEEQEICEQVAPYTMTSSLRVVSLIHASKHIAANDIAGDIVECGAWRGGSMMAVAETLKRLGDTTRKLFLYDTFEGMTEPGERDLQFDGRPAGELRELIEAKTGKWCYAGMEEVEQNLTNTGYPAENIRLIEGKVEDTIPATMPDRIALLRLDTDWYESTRHELVHLYPRLVSGGILIIDDYGHWRGSKEAVDEYFASTGTTRPFLHRIDYSGRLVVKP